MFNFSQQNKFLNSKVIVISSVAPEPTSAGQILLHRHLTQLVGWDVKVNANPYQTKNLANHRWQTKLIRRLEYTRFHRFCYDLEFIDQGKSWSDVIDIYQKDFDKQKNQTINNHNTIVLTVAHGDGCWAAQAFAQKYNLPLVSVFHDWWPDIPNIHSPLRYWLAQRFQELYLKSALALCVSEGMQNALGEHINSQIIYPIPEKIHINLESVDSSKALHLHSLLKIIYFGNLYDYADDLANLLNLTKNNSKIQVQIRGSNPNWTTEFKQEMRDRNLWLDFAPRKDLNDWLVSADAFLVVMSFDSNLRRRMETSFPSKLPEYAQFGKPIIIWGPKYCSAVKWGLRGDRAVCVTERNPRALIAALENLRRFPDLLNHYSQKSKIAAQTDFNPILIQNQFLGAIQNILY